MDAARPTGPRRRGAAARTATVGCFEARPHSITMTDRRSVAYQVEVDARWRDQAGTHQRLSWRPERSNTRSSRDDPGWRLDGAAVRGLEHLVDLDFGFTPATNVLQLSRIALKLGQEREVPVAWFDLDSASLVELPQSYERRSEASYWYEAPTVPYRALLEIAPNGFVQSYPGLWRLVA